MARFFLTLSYNGSSFNGWQIQENTPNTVQQVLQEKLAMLLKEPIELTGCGRTDTGVNACNYIAHFDAQCPDLISNKAHWIYKFNTVLPPAIAIQNIATVSSEAHARFHAQQRAYHYYISQQKNPFRDNFTYYVYGPLDVELMNRAAQLLTHYSDFTSFSKTNTQVKTNTCKITEARWLQSGPNEWRFTIKADRFLRGMVRAIVGTLLLVGKNKLTLHDFKKIIEARDRKQAGSNAPAHALFFTGASYPKHLYL